MCIGDALLSRLLSPLLLLRFRTAGEVGDGRFFLSYGNYSWSGLAARLTLDIRHDTDDNELRFYTLKLPLAMEWVTVLDLDAWAVIPYEPSRVVNPSNHGLLIRQTGDRGEILTSIRSD